MVRRRPGRGRGRGKKRAPLRALLPRTPAQEARPVKIPAKPTIQRDWSMITREAVRLFDHHRFVNPNARERAIHIVMERWETIFPLRVAMHRENRQLNRMDQQIAQLEAENTMMLLREANGADINASRLQRRANINLQRIITIRQTTVAKRLMERFELFERHLSRVPGPLRDELHALADPFWGSMKKFFVNYVVE